jgi:hypothetical protein
LIFAGKHRRSRIGNHITVGFILSLLILFSTLSYFHIEGLYAQNLKNWKAATHVSNEALVQSMPYPTYADMIAEADFDSSELATSGTLLTSILDTSMVRHIL